MYQGGTFSVPASGELPITVMFEGGTTAGDYHATLSVRVLAGSGGPYTVPVTATVTSKGLPT